MTQRADQMIDEVLDGSSINEVFDSLCEIKLGDGWEKGDEEFHFSRSLLGGRKAEGYKSADWKWVKSVVAKWPANSSSKPKLSIRVTVHDSHDKPINPGLTQEFLPDDLKSAKKYADHLVSEGIPVAVYIDGYIVYPLKQDMRATSCSLMRYYKD